MLQQMDEERVSRRLACAGLSFHRNIETPIRAFYYLLEMALPAPKSAIVRAVTRNLYMPHKHKTVARPIDLSFWAIQMFSSVQYRSRHEVVSAVICQSVTAVSVRKLD
jgi:hypothetical protein